jgi:hypothetical protein
MLFHIQIAETWDAHCIGSADVEKIARGFVAEFTLAPDDSAV